MGLGRQSYNSSAEWNRAMEFSESLWMINILNSA